MNQRFFAGLVTVLFVVAVEAEPTKKINILHLNADDHRADGAAALGNPDKVYTPTLDKLVERGFTFRHCYTMGAMIGAVCTPSRTMMLTGLSWQHIPGANAKSTLPTATEASTSLPRVMQAAGYQTFHAGKPGNSFSAGISAFEISIHLDDKLANGRANVSRVMGDLAVDFLDKKRDKSRPFYMYLAPSVPHDPRTAEPQFHGKYKPQEIKKSPCFLPQLPIDNGEMTVRDEKLEPWPRTEAMIQQVRADYYACISGLDYNFNRVIEKLKEIGEYENTIIVFTGDNGLSVGDHGLIGKQNLFEFGGMHVPCIIAGPGIPQGKSDALVYLMDIFPTFCDLGGAKIPAHVDAKSLMPIITGKQEKMRDALYTGYRDSQRAIRDQRWKLMRYPLINVTHLFDLQNDPYEMTDVSSQNPDKVKEMMALLAGEMKRCDDPIPLIVDNPVPAAWTPPGKDDLKKTKQAQQTQNPKKNKRKSP
jgi:arylsulfatase A-like enzyme